MLRSAAIPKSRRGACGGAGGPSSREGSSPAPLARGCRCQSPAVIAREAAGAQLSPHARWLYASPCPHLSVFVTVWGRRRRLVASGPFAWQRQRPRPRQPSGGQRRQARAARGVRGEHSVPVLAPRLLGCSVGSLCVVCPPSAHRAASRRVLGRAVLCQGCGTGLLLGEGLRDAGNQVRKPSEMVQIIIQRARAVGCR